MIYIALPAYNEAVALPLLIARIAVVSRDYFNNQIRVLVADDGSKDGTAQAARAAADRHGVDLTVITHEVNRGLGMAIKTALTNAMARTPDDDDIIITMDSDDTHLPGLIPRMVMLVQEGSDLVIASRYQTGARMVGIPWFRQLLSTGLSILFRIVYPIPGARDYSCGYRAYRAGVLRQASQRFGDSFFAEKGFACMVDILIKMHVCGAIVNEAPMILRYDRKPGATKMPVRRTIIETFTLLWRRRLGNMN